MYKLEKAHDAFRYFVLKSPVIEQNIKEYYNARHPFGIHRYTPRLNCSELVSWCGCHNFWKRKKNIELFITYT